MSELEKKAVPHRKLKWQRCEPLVVVTFPLPGQFLRQISGDLPSVEGHLQHRVETSSRGGTQRS